MNVRRSSDVKLNMNYVKIAALVLVFGFLFFGCTGVTYKVNPDSSITVLTYSNNPEQQFGNIVTNITDTCNKLNNQYNTGCMINESGIYYAKKITKASWFHTQIDKGEGNLVVYRTTINKTNVLDVLPNTPENYLSVNIPKDSLASIIENTLKNNKDNVTIKIEMPAKIVSATPTPLKIENKDVYYTYAQIENGVQITAKNTNMGNVYLLYLVTGIVLIIILFVIFSWYRAKERQKRFLGMTGIKSTKGTKNKKRRKISRRRK